MLAAVLSASANALAYDFIVDGIYYNILSEDDKTVEVTFMGYNSDGYPASYYSGDVVIPEKAQYNGVSYSVTSIGDYAFYCSGLKSIIISNSVITIGESAFDDSDLTSVTIGNNVTSIQNGAFYRCRSLSSITIPEKVVSIGNTAFAECERLASLTIPNSVVSIGSYAFAYCSRLTSVTLSNNITSIADCVFRECHNLSSIIIPESVTSIGNYAFSGCSSLTSLTIPNSVNSIGNSAFSKCSSLTTVTIPENVTSIGNSAFSGCSSLKSVTIPNSVTTIGNAAFGNCSSLASVSIGNSVTSIGEDAFYNCISLTSVSISKGVTSVGKNAFEGCSSLDSINISDLSSWCKIDFSNSYANPLYYGNNLYLNGKIVTNLIIPNKVTEIKRYTFYNCKSLVSVNIPNSVTSIGDRSFFGCSGLQSLIVGVNVRSIVNSAFYRYEPTGYYNEPIEYLHLKKVIWLPNTPPTGYENVSSERNYVANYSYSELENVTVYPYLSSMFEVGGLKYVPVSPSERTCDAIDCSYDDTAANIVIGKTVSYQGIEMTLLDVKDYVCYGNDYIKTLSIKEYDGDIGNDAFMNCKGLTTVSIQDREGNVNEKMFYNCTGLETVDISTMKGSIGNMAFYNCENFKGIEIPNTVTGIGASCFFGCSSLEYATIGSGISELPASCFSGCSSLPEIVIPSTVGSIGNNAFYGCSALARINIADRQTELVLGHNSYYISSKKYESPLFSSCPLDSVYIGGNISYGTDSGSGYSPFYRNTSLRAVKITDQETEISENEFYGCTGLKSVELGDGIESIGNYAFSGCSALDRFTFGNSLTTIGNEAFSDCTAMKWLVSKTEVPPVCGSQALDDINKWTCKLYVPDNTIDVYKAAEQWKEFFFISDDECDFSKVQEVTASKNSISVIPHPDYIEIKGGIDKQIIYIYNIKGQLIYSGTKTVINVPAKGIYIVKVAGQTFKVAL